jgi:hypothetical protein
MLNAQMLVVDEHIESSQKALVGQSMASIEDFKSRFRQQLKCVQYSCSAPRHCPRPWLVVFPAQHLRFDVYAHHCPILVVVECRLAVEKALSSNNTGGFNTFGPTTALGRKPIMCIGGACFARVWLDLWPPSVSIAFGCISPSAS